MPPNTDPADSNAYLHTCATDTIPPTATHTFTPVPPTPIPTDGNTYLYACAADADPTTIVPPTATQQPAPPGIDLLTIPVLPNLGDPGVANQIKQINGVGKQNGVVAGYFALVGDNALTGVGGADDKNAKLDQYQAS